MRIWPHHNREIPVSTCWEFFGTPRETPCSSSTIIQPGLLGTLCTFHHQHNFETFRSFGSPHACINLGEGAGSSNLATWTSMGWVHSWDTCIQGEALPKSQWSHGQDSYTSMVGYGSWWVGLSGSVLGCLHESSHCSSILSHNGSHQKGSFNTQQAPSGQCQRHGHHLLFGAYCRSVGDGAGFWNLLRLGVGHERSGLLFWLLMVLFWMKSTQALSAYVGNCITRIAEHSDHTQWLHVPMSLNPADLLTQGKCPQDMPTKDLWWYGPPFLLQLDEAWPTQPQLYQTTDTAEEVHTMENICKNIVLVATGLHSICFGWNSIQITNERYSIARAELLEQAPSNFERETSWPWSKWPRSQAFTFIHRFCHFFLLILMHLEQGCLNIFQKRAK